MNHQPELILRDIRFYGGDVRHDLLVSGGRVAEIVPVGQLDAPGIQIVNCDGRFVGPGLWDEHTHFTQWVIRQQRFDLAGTESAAHVLALVRNVLATTTIPAGEVIAGYGFRDAVWPDAPTLRALDDVAPDRPVVLISGDLHCAWINTAAARLANVSVGETGLLREGDWIGAPMDALGRGRLPSLADYRDAADAAASRGVIGIVDYENTDNSTEWPERVAAGVTSLRVEGAIWPDRLEESIAAGLRTGQVLDERGLITVGRLKIVVDGSLNTRTAFCWDPYPSLGPEAPHRCGILSVEPREVRRLLERADSNGILPAVHAIGDRANTEVIDAFVELGIAGIIEHAQLVSEKDFARFAPAGLIASVQPEHAMDDRDAADLHWAGRTGRAFAFGSLHAAGATLRFGSDAPVAPLDPWQAISAATTRARDEREPWHPEQRLDLAVALSSSSRGRSSIDVGSVADLVILDHDPFITADLRNMPVAATLLGGRFTWSTL